MFYSNVRVKLKNQICSDLEHMIASLDKITIDLLTDTIFNHVSPFLDMATIPHPYAPFCAYVCSSIYVYQFTQINLVFLKSVYRKHPPLCFKYLDKKIFCVIFLKTG